MTQDRPQPRRRLLLRNLDFSQKLLVATILLAVGAGYLGALANLFQQHAGADGVATIKFDELYDSVKTKGAVATLNRVADSLGKQDVIRVYHGSGSTRMEAALNGTMMEKAPDLERSVLIEWSRLPEPIRKRTYQDGLPTKAKKDDPNAPTQLEMALKGSMKSKILEELAGKPEEADATQKALADGLNQMLIGWSHLSADLRKQAYEQGVPLKESGVGDLDAFVAAAKANKLAELKGREPIIKDTVQNNCVTCHAPGADDKAEKYPLGSLAELEKFCVPASTTPEPDFAVLASLLGPDAKKDAFTNVKRSPLVTDILKQHCTKCHASGSNDAQARNLPLATFDEVNGYCEKDRGMSFKQLALSTHVHLLGFSVLFAVTGFLFSLTSYPGLVRVVFVPWTLFFQIIEIVCWWLAKLDSLFAIAIFYLGPIVGIGLGIQLLGTLLDLIFRRRTAD